MIWWFGNFYEEFLIKNHNELVWNETYFVPASLASSSLAMPLSLFVFLAVCFLPNCWSALNLDQAKTDSTIPDLSNFLVKRSLNVHLDPNLLIWRVIISFVWESKVGLTTRQLTNNHKWFLIYILKWKKRTSVKYSWILGTILRQLRGHFLGQFKRFVW